MVTVFSISGCQFCIKAKNALANRSIPFVEINLTLHPDKRTDMLSLSDSFTVPQIFFNDKHIGGATEVLAVLKQWDEEEDANNSGKSLSGGQTTNVLEIFKREVQLHPDPIDPRLTVPSPVTDSDQYVEPPRRDDDRILIELDLEGVTMSLSVLDVMTRLHGHLNVACCASIGGWVYPNVFLKTKLITALRTEFGKSFPSTASDMSSTSKLSRASSFCSALTVPSAHGDEAEQWQHLIALLQKRNILHPIPNTTSSSYLRLQSHHTPRVLNSFRIWTDRVDPDAMAIVKRLTHLLNQISSRSTQPETSLVNLQLATQDSQYHKFQEGVCELQSVEMSTMDSSTRTAFVINVYNLMIKYAQIKLGIPNATRQRLAYFDDICINIGGLLYSFNHLESGILRGNRHAPYHFYKPFREDGSDAREKLALEKVDPRIHFALNCGAASCPPVKEFTAKGLEEELRVVAVAFCEQDENVSIPSSRKEGGTKKLRVGLSQIFKWYHGDFCSSNKSDLLHTLLGYLRGEKKELLAQNLENEGRGWLSSVSISYLPYEWKSPTVSHEKIFNRSDLKSHFFSINTLLPKLFPSLNCGNREHANTVKLS